MFLYLFVGLKDLKGNEKVIKTIAEDEERQKVEKDKESEELLVDEDDDATFDEIKTWDLRIKIGNFESFKSFWKFYRAYVCE